jgi:glycosyltransferase involved in cell wall biosynthesis
MVNRIYINGRFLTQPLSGMQRFAEEMVSALDALLVEDSGKLPGVESIEVLVPPGQYRHHNWMRVTVRQVGNLTGHAWEQINLAWAARDGVLVNLAASGPWLHSCSVLVLHDAAIFAHPKHFARSYRLWHSLLRPRIARRAKRLVTISEFSRRELAYWCGVPENAFTIVNDSAEHITHVESDLEVLTRHGLRKGAYALTVGNQSPNKNIALAISAFERAAPEGWPLAVAGGGSDKIFGSTEAADKECVKRLGRVNDSELKALYENAGLFLFPSRYEGFGVPPLEAMALGCPVLSSNASAMPEVLGDAAVYFESDDVEDFAQQIKRLLADETSRERYVAVGRQRALSFSWKRSAEVMLGILQSLIG